MDACSPNAAETIENAVGSLAGENIAVQVRLLALDPPRSEERALRRLTRRLENRMTANVSNVETEEDMRSELSAELEEAETETTPTETGEITTDTGETDTGETGTTPTETGDTTTDPGETETTPTGEGAAFRGLPAAELARRYRLRSWTP